MSRRWVRALSLLSIAVALAGCVGAARVSPGTKSIAVEAVQAKTGGRIERSVCLDNTGVWACQVFVRVGSSSDCELWASTITRKGAEPQAWRMTSHIGCRPAE